METFINNEPLPLIMLFLLAGFALLIKGADFFVDGSSSVARRLKVPPIIIGLTIVAMGTSLPETAVSVTASLMGNNTMAISNVIGSNIFNLMVVIGVCALMASVEVEEDTIKRDIPFSAVCAVLLVGLGFLRIGDSGSMMLGRLDGIIMLVFFVFYLGSMLRRAKQGRLTDEDVEEGSGKILSVPMSLFYIIGGAAAIAFGGDITVDAASRIAVDLGMSQTLVGLTIVSIGTSLPELVTSIVAARKNEIGMALGNAIGSNIFNVLMVLGIASVVSPLTLITENLIDIVILLGFSLLVWIMAATKRRIDKKEGLLMVLLYAGFAVYICVR